jgi:RNA polymerase sigma factor (sigma-70 family)
MSARSHLLLRSIRRSAASLGAVEASDDMLLERFVACRDDEAFTAIVERHGRLVLHVCRRMLGEIHDAEDAFQAVFLVLARKANTVRPRESLAGWLHGVARRVALKVRAGKARHPRENPSVAESTADRRPDPMAEISARELLLVVDEEIHMLPRAYRLPVILCCLEGRSQEEAARHLGWTPGSVKGRLERGRARLHQRLVRRGLTLSAALAAAEAVRGPASAAIIAQTAALALKEPGGFSPAVTALAESVLRSMAAAKLRAAASAVLVGGILALGLLVYRMAAVDPPVVDATPPIRDQAAPVDVRDPFDIPVQVSGQVQDPGGRPLPGARLYVGYAVTRLMRDVHPRQTSYPCRATSGADGRFQFTFARGELNARWLDDSRPAVIAVAAGYGPSWAEIAEGDQAAELRLRLVEDVPVHGRIVDRTRKPVAGATVRVVDVSGDTEVGMTQFLAGKLAAWYPQTWRGSFPEQPPITSDADGRFSLTGLGRDRLVALAVDGPAIQHDALTIVTRPSGALPPTWAKRGTTFEHSAAPAQVIRGVVRDAVTGLPVSGVRVCAYQHHPPALTDADGRFEITGAIQASTGHVVMAEPRDDQLYFAAKSVVAGKGGSDPLTVTVDLVRGIALQGRVVDPATGKPPRAATVEYYPLFPNLHSKRLTNCHVLAASATTVRSDGAFRVAVLPGPGVLCVAASPRSAYAAAVVDEGALADLFHDGQDHGKGGQLRIAVENGGEGYLAVTKYSTLAFINPDEQAESLSRDIILAPARSLPGTVLGKDGEPLGGVEVRGLTATPQDERLDGASFTVTGLNPHGSRRLVLHHREQGLGRVITVRGGEVGPLVVQLLPCGSITGRLVDKGAKPISEPNVYFWGNADALHVPVEVDGDGRFRAALLPGEKYLLMRPKGPYRSAKDVVEFEVGPGQTIDLGDLSN